MLERKIVKPKTKLRERSPLNFLLFADRQEKDGPYIEIVLEERVAAMKGVRLTKLTCLIV
jgi:hypothetical protein